VGAVVGAELGAALLDGSSSPDGPPPDGADAVWPPPACEPDVWSPGCDAMLLPADGVGLTAWPAPEVGEASGDVPSKTRTGDASADAEAIGSWVWATGAPGSKETGGAAAIGDVDRSRMPTERVSTTAPTTAT
jgi:hypothetical protein